jgi:nitroreductase/uncharacterized protein YciI
MKFFIVEGVFVNPCPVSQDELNKAIAGHIAYLDQGFDDGSILVSGPKSQGGGGFIIMKAESEEDIFDFLEKDPMKVLGVQTYYVNEFNIHKSLPFACDWFGSESKTVGDANEVLKAIKGRRSVRAYTDKQLTEEETALIVEAGSFAPSAHNEQPWHFTVVQNKELLDEMNRKANEIMAKSDNEWLKGLGTNPNFRASYDAPTVIVVSGKDGAISAQTDCAAAIENMMLAAYSLGIGAVWVGLLWPYLHGDEARAALRIPEGFTIQHAIAFGYPAGGKLPAPPRKSDIVTYIR